MGRGAYHGQPRLGLETYMYLINKRGVAYGLPLLCFE